jgi:hypothetical protein
MTTEQRFVERHRQCWGDLALPEGWLVAGCLFQTVRNLRSGLAPLYEGGLTPNPLTAHAALFTEKVRSYRARWPWLQIEQGR